MTDGGMLDVAEPRGIGKHFVAPAARRGTGGGPQLDALASALRLGPAEPGTVYLVGAGPGDPGLVTARAARLVATADVVLHDLLVAREVIALARPDAELYDVGKVGDGRHVAQEDTNALMVRLAQEGRSVVRLKGGDPFVFGRGGEELGELLEAGVRAEVVAGVTAGTGALAAAGIPGTHRGVSQAVAFVTGHGAGDTPEGDRDWQSLATFPGTLVFYMAVKGLRDIARALIAHGRSADEPAAIVERGTTDRQRTTRATLGEIGAVAAREGVRAPALVVVGPVAALADQLDWRGARPLAGRTVVVTRAGEQAGTLAGRLRGLGAAVLELPAIEIIHTGAELPSLEGVDLLTVTSPAAAGALWAALRAAGRDARALAGSTLVAIGPGTADALAAHGLVADLLPKRAVSEGLLDALDEAGVIPARAVVVQAEGGRQLLAQELTKRGAQVTTAALHRTQPVPLTDDELATLAAADAVLFASGSAAKSVAASLASSGASTPAELRAALGTARPVAIGPTTATAMRDLGIQPAAVADPHTVDGLIAATADLLA
ncbi:MAG: uroporphyrinogen-III C-methyltransferase [Patulibacter minatonensis]